MALKITTVKVPASATRGFWTRPIWQKSMDAIVNGYQRKGWRLTQTTPVANRNGKTTHYLLTFEKT